LLEGSPAQSLAHPFLPDRSLDGDASHVLIDRAYHQIARSIPMRKHRDVLICLLSGIVGLLVVSVGLRGADTLPAQIPDDAY
jgi:hypothetical protein